MVTGITVATLTMLQGGVRPPCHFSITQQLHKFLESGLDPACVLQLSVGMVSGLGFHFACPSTPHRCHWLKRISEFLPESQGGANGGGEQGCVNTDNRPGTDTELRTEQGRWRTVPTGSRDNIYGEVRHSGHVTYWEPSLPTTCRGCLHSLTTPTTGRRHTALPTYPHNTCFH